MNHPRISALDAAVGMVLAANAESMVDLDHWAKTYNQSRETILALFAKKKMNAAAYPVAGGGEMSSRYVAPLNQRDRSLERSVWSQPPINSDLHQRVRAAERGSAKLLAALRKMAGVSATAVPAPAPRPILKQPITLGPDASKTQRIAAIQAAVADHYGISLKDMIEGNHARHLARPRQVAMYLAKTTIKASPKQIAPYFNRDYTTVYLACRVVASTPSMDADVEALRERLAA